MLGIVVVVAGLVVYVARKAVLAGQRDLEEHRRLEAEEALRTRARIDAELDAGRIRRGHLYIGPDGVLRCDDETDEPPTDPPPEPPDEDPSRG